MKKYLLTIVAVLAFVLGYIIKPAKDYKVQDIYYDGEGNVIPNEVVQLLVTSQFVIIQPEEQKTLDSYFYFNK